MSKFEELLEASARNNTAEFQKVLVAKSSLSEFKLLMSLSNMADSVSDVIEDDTSLSNYLRDVSLKLRSHANKKKSKSA